ncbi:hypothetical protein SUGI_0092170 [Cryptomeria japonica]|nr:hypothetical protein SUGI_0092170 [Cryptomeria japonica]
MSFNPSSDDEKRAVVNPKDLRFIQPNIKSTFKNATHPSVIEAVSLIRKGELNPAVFGELTVHRDEQGVVWCKNNRRLYVLRMAGVSSVRIKFINNGFMVNKLKEADKNKLKDPAFMPKIRGEKSGGQSPLPPISFLLGVLGAVLFMHLNPIYIICY